MLYFLLICSFLAINSPQNPQDSTLLWLVNQETPLPQNYGPNLAKQANINLHPQALEAFNQMAAAMVADDIHGLFVQSSYRTYSHQQKIFNQRLQELTAQGESPGQAAIITESSIRRPGTSEHQLGLAIDVSLDGQLNETFANSPAGQWLQANCHRYGFIIRYPQGKTHITGTIYEPWHLRYVGMPHASLIHSLDLTLEEYLWYVHLSKMLVFWCEDLADSYYLIKYFCQLPEHMPLCIVDISSLRPGGDGGFIITSHKTYKPES
ncbi:MAG: M15 family metallopeptidase [Defluviitaleaceae bacterium]|nr:M15 family metallopeptidase [Defluviitaleaceae bacterium]